MYALVDRPVESLSNGGRFLLWAMRGWTQALEGGTCPPVALARGFACFHALPALADFHIAMALLNSDGRRRISLAPMNCRRIIEDEAVLIAMWRDLSLAEFDRVKGTLGLLANEASVSPVFRAMTMASAKLMAAGFDLSDISRETTKELK